MKKVLILAYDFPPYVSVGGLRPYSWYKYFYEFGLYPVVVTRQWGNKYGNHLDYIAPGESSETLIEESETGTIIRTAYKPNLSNRLLLKYGEKHFRLLRKSITAYYEFMQFLFFIGPKAGLYRGAKQYLKQHKVNAIIATGDPFVLFKYANKLAKAHGIPWFADYRDPWVQDKMQNKNILRIKWESYNEQCIVKHASTIFSVSSFFLKLILSNFNNTLKSKVIINGYNDENVPDSKAIFDNNRLIITYAGSLYAWHPVEMALKVFDKLIAQGLKLEIRFIGVNNINRIHQYLQYLTHLKKHIVFETKISNSALLKKLSQSHLLLLFNDYSISGTKIYDYLAVSRPILLCFKNDKEAIKLKALHFHLPKISNESEALQAEIIEETNGGHYITNQAELSKFVEQYWFQLQNLGDINCNSKNITQYARKTSVKALAKYINKNITE